MTPLEALLLFGNLIALVTAVFVVIGIVGGLLYDPDRGEERAENVRFVVTTIGSESVATTLASVIDHTLATFPEYELYVLTDEGADLEDDLRADDRFETVVVPDDFECEATAKGRAIQYFVETVVADEQEYWYAFLDDDNEVRGRDILYEIPVYERRGYHAANPVLVPRQGHSATTFVMDHVRTLDDLTVFRTFTGLLGRPLVGFHGELLTVRGDTLAEVGFDRESIVEDFAFAAELVRRDLPVWQTGSRVSILSPHSTPDLFKQRRRWFLGLLAELRRCPPSATLVMGLRMVAWTFATVGGVVFAPLWLLTGDSTPLLAPLVMFSSAIYFLAYLYGVRSVQEGLLARLGRAIVLPVYPALESLVSVYSLATRSDSFVVIDK